VVGGQRFLSLRCGQRCARTPSEYMREAALGARETQMPAWDTLRDFRNELIRLTPGNTGRTGRDRALEAAKDALERITLMPMGLEGRRGW
jgi:hypothetical protein